MNSEENQSTSSRRVTRSQGNRQVINDKFDNDNISNINRNGSMCNVNMLDALYKSSVKSFKGSRREGSVVSALTSRMSAVNIASVIKQEKEIAQESLEGKFLVIEAEALAKKAEAMRLQGLEQMERSKNRERHSHYLSMQLDEEEKPAAGAYRDEIKPETEMAAKRADKDLMRSFIDDCRSNRMTGAAKEGRPLIVDQATVKVEKGNGMNIIKTDMPRVTLPIFDGNVADYWNFRKQFEVHVESRTDDADQRMLYLLNHCTGKALRAVKSVANMPAAEAYPEAMRTLKQLFGRPHDISRGMIDRLLRLPDLRRYDSEAMSDLLLSMTECYGTLKQMNYMADLDTAATMKRIVDKLPGEMIDKWIDKADSINEEGREANFLDLKQFIAKETRRAGSRYADKRKRELNVGRANPTSGFVKYENKWKTNEPAREDAWKADRNRVVNYINQTPVVKGRLPCCMVCKEAHSTAQCKKYIDLAINLRWEAVKSGGGCFSCLELGHSVKACLSRKACGINDCVKRHHPSLHREQEVIAAPLKTVLTSIRKDDRYVSLGFVPVIIKGPKGAVTICALLDTGSNTTLIKRDIVNKVGVKGRSVDIDVHTVTGSSTMGASKCEVEVQAIDNSDRVQMEEVYAVDRLPIELRARTIPREEDRWPHLKGITRSEMDGCIVEMIIGCDQFKAHRIQDVRLGPEDQPFGLKTPLGWIVLGPTHQAAVKAVYCTEVQDKGDGEIENLTKQLYNKEFEDLGGDDKGLSIEEREAVQILTTGTRREGSQYVLPLPWKTYPPELENNRVTAERRLDSLKRRFSIHPNLIERYDGIFKEHERKGYIARVSAAELSSAQAWYLPHHPVVNPQKPDKLRIVFDCAAQYRGRSINDCLHQGPDTIASLVGVLLRFRRSAVAIIADIEEMFLQVRLDRRDQDWMRFLWWEDGKLGGRVETYKMLVHPFGARSSPFCANFALKQAILDNQSDMSEASLNIANGNIYVDDCIASVDTVEEAKQVIAELTMITRKGGFRLRKWLSNKKEVLASIPLEDLSSKVQLLTNNDLPMERTLGVEWDAEGDKLRFTFKNNCKPSTRRGVLSTIAAVFDPLGLISPIIMRAKILLQALCRKKMEWDQPLEEADLKTWTEWKEQMEFVNKIEFPRYNMDGNSTENAQLHVFADASEVGYGAVAYARVKAGNGYKCRLLMSKARVAPLKTVTIPRLELSAAVLAVRLSAVINKELKGSFKETYFWVDSTIVLHYLRNTSSRFVTFVANRIQEILEATKVNQWRHVRSEQNPADFTSRGLAVNDGRMQLWMDGPQFIWEGEDQWPVLLNTEPNLGQLETKKVVLHIDAQESMALDKIITYYSNWDKMVRAVAWLSRFIEYYKAMKGKGTTVRIGKLTVKELVDSEASIVKYVQSKAFKEEYKALSTNNKHFDWRVNRLRKLSPELRNGFIVVGGRLQFANLNEERKHPIVLPKDHALTKVIIMHVHASEGHAGVNQTLDNLRNRYWVLNGGATVKSVLRKCLTCRRLNATSMGQKMAPLPEFRVKDGWNPFQYVGMDYFGPFMVRRGRLLERRYGCIFTCLQCRAIHLELAQSLSTDSFILALMRFINRRGTPVEIISDNGGNFIGAEKELGTWLKGLTQERITEQLADKRIVWKFNPPNASHRGGVWERLIRSVRKVLNSVAGRQSMDEEVLWTYLTQAERIINDRPLLAVREGSSEPTPIRASDLLQPRSNSFVAINLPLGQLVERRWKMVNSLTAEFWNKWKACYLNTLQERQKWFRKERELQEGDIVITEVESTPRTFWPLGVVEQVIPDGDGIVRTVVIRTSSGTTKRDIRKVYMLEGAGST